MRKMLASLGVLCFASMASAQTVDPTLYQQLRVDAGSGGVAWKIAAPSGASDWANVDLGGLATGFDAVAVLLDSVENLNAPAAWREVAFRTSNANGDPDTTAGGLIAGQANAPVAPLDGWGDEYGWTVPTATLGTDVHATVTWYAGDSNLWIVIDGDANLAGRSFGSADAYATAGVARTNDWVLGAVGFAQGYQNNVLVNGGASATVKQGGQVCVTFSACAPNAGSALYLFAPIFFGPLAPIPLTITGNPFTGGPLNNQWTICVVTDCTFPTGGPFSLGTIFLDPCDLKPNGKPRPKLSGTGDLTINAARFCSGCFGLKDDEQQDGTWWAVQGIAGPSDYFNVNHGTAPSASGVNMLTGVEIASYETCGAPAQWATVGIFPDNAANPGAPDLAFPFGVDPSPTVAANSTETTYPATLYSVPPFAANTTTTYHTVVQWAAGESCLWVSADTTGDSGSCADPIGGTAFTSSAWTLDGYSTGALYVNYANWMMQIKWN